MDVNMFLVVAFHFLLVILGHHIPSSSCPGDRKEMEIHVCRDTIAKTNTLLCSISLNKTTWWFLECINSGKLQVCGLLSTGQDSFTALSV